MDVGLGAALADESKVAVEDIDDVDRPKDRKLVININKNRTGPVGAVELYQSPTLRFFDSQSDYYTYKNALAASTSNLAKLYQISRPRQIAKETFGEVTEEFPNAKVS